MSIKGVSGEQVAEFFNMIQSNSQLVSKVESTSPGPQGVTGVGGQVGLAKLFQMFQGDLVQKNPALAQVAQLAVEISRVVKAVMGGASFNGQISVLLGVLPVFAQKVGALSSTMTLPTLLAGGGLLGLYAFRVYQKSSEPAQKEAVAEEVNSLEEKEPSASVGTSLEGRVVKIPTLSSEEAASNKESVDDKKLIIPRQIRQKLELFSSACRKASISFTPVEQKEAIEAIFPLYEKALTDAFSWGGLLLLKDFHMTQEELEQALKDEMAEIKATFRSYVDTNLAFRIDIVNQKHKEPAPGKVLRAILAGFESVLHKQVSSAFSQGKISLNRQFVKDKLRPYWGASVGDRYNASLEAVKKVLL